MTDIAYIVSYGFAALKIRQTDLLGKVVLSGRTVGLMAPHVDDNSLKNYCEERGIKLYEFKPKLEFKLGQCRNNRKC